MVFFFPPTSDHIFISAASVNWPLPFALKFGFSVTIHLRWSAEFAPEHLF